MNTLLAPLALLTLCLSGCSSHSAPTPADPMPPSSPVASRPVGAGMLVDPTGPRQPVTCKGSGPFEAAAGTLLEATNGQTIYARAGSSVYAGAGATVFADPNSLVYAESGSTVFAGDHATIHAYKGSIVFFSSGPNSLMACAVDDMPPLLDPPDGGTEPNPSTCSENLWASASGGLSDQAGPDIYACGGDLYEDQALGGGSDPGGGGSGGGMPIK